MEKLKQDLKYLNNFIMDLENQIKEAKNEAENNIKPLNTELVQVKKDKKEFAIKKDFDSVQICRRKENNLKFKIDAQWNKYFMLTDELYKLNKQKTVLEAQIKLEEDKIKRHNQIRSHIDEVLKNYKKPKI